MKALKSYIKKVLMNFKISRKYNTLTGIYYLPVFAWNDIIKKEICAGKIFQPEIIDIAKQFVEKDSIVLDIGANYGQLSVLFSKLKKGVTVHAFEAQKFIHKLLVKNIDINSANVVPYYKLVGNVTKVVNVKKDELSIHKTWGSNHIQVSESEANTNKIDAIKIDDLNFQKKITFIKIDVQGMDLEVLKGAVNTINQHKMPILFEYERCFESTFNYNFSDFEDFIESINYEIRLKSGDDYLIVPSS